MSNQLSLHRFISDVHEATTSNFTRSRLTLLSRRVTDRSYASRWDAPRDGQPGLNDEDIVGFLGRLTEQVGQKRPDARGNDSIGDAHTESFRGLLARFVSIVESRGVNYQGHGFSCRAVLASIHASLPEFADELEILDIDHNARYLEPAS